jgi:hypothetical protein
MRKLIVFVAVALAIPTSVALAKAPATHTNSSKASPTVTYVLKGTLSGYTAATSTTDGSISIAVSHSNFHSSLKGQTLSFTVASSTKITNQNGATQTTVAPGTKGTVKFRAPLHPHVSGTNLAAVLPTMAKAFHVIVRQAG